MAWDIRNLFQPMAPGMSGAVNPLSMIGAGMAQGNPLGAAAQMGNIQMQAQALRQRQEQAFAAQMMQAAQMRQQQAYQNQMVALREQAANKPPAITVNAEAYMNATPEVRAIMDKLQAGPSTVINVGAGEAAKSAQAESVLDIGSELESLISGDKVNPEGIAGLWTQYRAQPTVGAGLARFVQDVSADESRAVQLTEMLSQQLLQAMRGAQVGPLEEERFKRSLPVFGAPNFSTNLQTTLENITKLENKRRELRGQAKIPETPIGGVGGAAAPGAVPGDVKVLGIRRVD